MAHESLHPDQAPQPAQADYQFAVEASGFRPTHPGETHPDATGFPGYQVATDDLKAGLDGLGLENGQSVTTFVDGRRFRPVTVTRVADGHGPFQPKDGHLVTIGRSRMVVDSRYRLVTGFAGASSGAVDMYPADPAFIKDALARGTEKPLLGGRLRRAARSAGALASKSSRN